jgi:tetrahydromethanopterin S-methyltransferase subunit B
VRKYSELFDAKLTLLISMVEIPEEIKRLSKTVEQLLSQPDKEKIILAHFDSKKGKFEEWFPKNPFKKPWYNSLF